MRWSAEPPEAGEGEEDRTRCIRIFGGIQLGGRAVCHMTGRKIKTCRQAVLFNYCIMLTIEGYFMFSGDMIYSGVLGPLVNYPPQSQIREFARKILLGNILPGRAAKASTMYTTNTPTNIGRRAGLWTDAPIKLHYCSKHMYLRECVFSPAGRPTRPTFDQLGSHLAKSEWTLAQF